MRLQGKSALVTGAGSGLGKSIALAFARQGAKVAAADLHRDDADQTVREIVREGGLADAIRVDISDTEQIRAMFAQIERSCGRLDILVNNAGITGRSLGDGPVDACSEEAWDLISGTNLRGTFMCCKYGLPLMLKQGGGAIVNMSSVLGLVGCQDFFVSHAYQTTKAGIIGLTRSIAAYYAKSGIRANALAPGLIATKATEKVYGNEEIMAFTRRMQPLGGLGHAEEVALAAVYLASDEASFVTGQVLAIDGGWTVQ